ASLDLRRPFLVPLVKIIDIDALLFEILSGDGNPVSGFLARSGNLFTYVTLGVGFQIEEISQCLLLVERYIFKEIFHRYGLRNQHRPIQFGRADAECSADAKAECSQNETTATEHRSRVDE